MKHSPKIYPCWNTTCNGKTDKPNTPCEECRRREEAEARALTVNKNDDKRRKA